MTLEMSLVLVAAFGAGLIDAMAGGGGLIQVPALFAAFPTASHTALLGTGKLAGLAGTSSAVFRYIRHVRLDWRLVGAAAAGVIGLYDGFFGPGTGSFLVFLFIRAFGLDFLHASASAKVVNAAANVAALLLFGLTVKLFWLLGLGMAVCNVVGAQVGSHLAIRGGSALVRKVFLAVVSCLIAKTAWDALALHLW